MVVAEDPLKRACGTALVNPKNAERVAQHVRGEAFQMPALLAMRFITR